MLCTFMIVIVDISYMKKREVIIIKLRAKSSELCSESVHSYMYAVCFVPLNHRKHSMVHFFSLRQSCCVGSTTYIVHSALLDIGFKKILLSILFLTRPCPTLSTFRMPHYSTLGAYPYT